VCLGEIVESAVQAVRPRAEAKQIGIEVHPRVAVPTLPLDRAAMTDAIGNLLDNAIKYSPPVRPSRLWTLENFLPAPVKAARKYREPS
jgi:signal transduction histidine kinase